MIGWLIFLQVLFISPSFAAPSQQEFNRTFSSGWLQFVSDDDVKDGTYPGFLRWIFEDVAGREPSTEPSAFKAGCAPDDLERDLRSTVDARRQAAVVELHMRRCPVETGAGDRILGSLNLLRLRFDASSHPFIERVRLNLPGGTVLHGLLALKGDRLKRPFVIVRLGIFSDPFETFAERFLLMQLFEQGPFNVLVLEGTTGGRFIATNPGFAIGGGAESLQNLQIARRLRDPAEPLSSIISSLHLVGISLGGHGLWGAAALDPRQPGGPFVQSFAALCPVVDLKGTFVRGTEAGFQNAVADVWVRRRLRDLADRVPEVTESHWMDWIKGRPVVLPAALDFARQSADRARPLAEGLSVPSEYLRMLGPDHDPWPWFKDIKAPFLVMATKDDDMVPADLNALVFDEKMRQGKDNAALAMFDRGFHCTLPVSYDWNTMTAALNGSLLAASTWRTKTQSLDLDLGDVVSKPKGAPAYSVDWPSEGEFVSLKVNIEGEDGRADFSVSLPLSEFDFKIHDAKLSEPVRQTFTRWLHRYLKLSVESKEDRSFLKITWPAPG